MTGLMAAVANHLWQSSLFAGAMWLLAIVLRKNSASVRYAVWMAASVKFLVPFALLVSLGGHFAWKAAPKIVQAPAAQVVEEIGQPFDWVEGPQEMSLAATSALQSGSGAPGSVVTPSVSSRARWMARLPEMLIGLWLCGVVLGLGSWRRWVLRMRDLRRSGTEMELGLPLPVLSSPIQMEPCVFGLLRPVMVLPEGIAERLTAAELDAVIAHELSHLRRRDNLTAAVHFLVETVFWFWPVLRWVRTRLMEERELACDEAVLRDTNEPGVYAEGILKVCRFYLASEPTVAAGVSGSNLKRRIEVIVNYREALRMSVARKSVLAMVAVLAVCVPVVFGQMKAGPIASEVFADGQTVSALVNFAAPLQANAAGAVSEAEVEQKTMGTKKAASGGPVSVSGLSPAEVGSDRLCRPETEGNQGISSESILGTTFLRIGDAYDATTVRRSFNALWNTGLFEKVQIERVDSPLCIQLVIQVREKATIRDASYHPPQAGGAAGASAPDISGTWQGTVTAATDARNTFRVVLQVEKSGSGSSGLLYLPGGVSDTQSIEVQTISVQNGVVRFPIGENRFEGKLSADGGSLAGTWNSGTQAQQVTLTRATAETAWDTPAAQASQRPMVNRDPSFDVGAIKPTDPAKPARVPYVMVKGRTFTSSGTTLKYLLQYAYNVNGQQLANLPEWAGKDRYDLNATVAEGEGNPNQAQWKTMLRKLLAERFQLQFHHEKRELPAFALMVAGSPKLTPASPYGLFKPPSMGYAFRPNGYQGMGMNLSMADFANTLGRSVLDRPVVDRTGLTGHYDIQVTFSGELTDRAPLPPAAGQPVPDDIFKALQEQLGLRLESVKAPVDVTVLDKVAMPSAN